MVTNYSVVKGVKELQTNLVTLSWIFYFWSMCLLKMHVAVRK